MQVFVLYVLSLRRKAIELGRVARTAILQYFPSVRSLLASTKKRLGRIL